MTLGQMKALVSQRLNEAGNPVFYPASEIQNALNESQRLWCLLTLCLEKTATWNTAPTWTHLLPLIPDYLAPLRLTTQTGMKVRPARISELFALDSQWPASVGPTYRYVALGADLVGIYPTWPQPLQLQYAGSPATLVADADTPQIPAEFHEQLVKFGCYRLRMVEGGAEFAKVLPLLDEFLSVADEYAKYVRARNIGAGYDSLPFELSSFDRSLLVGKAKGRK